MEELELYNPQNEMIVLGSLYSKPIENGFTYLDIIANSDFNDDAMSFFHAFFNDYITTYSNEITQTKANLFASMDNTRLKTYKKFGGYKTIESIMSLATNSSEELKGQVDELKKWSVLRQLNKNGYDVSRILNHPRFNSLSADDCANIIRGGLDKICNKVITGIDDTVDMANGVSSLMDNFLEEPEHGYDCMFPMINNLCSGIMEHDSYCFAMQSNSGKSRLIISFFTHLALVENLNVALFSNESSFEAMRLASITTVLNSPQIQALHGNQLNITEKRFKSGTYLNDHGEIIYRKKDSTGEFIETIDQFKKRLEIESKEYVGVKDAVRWYEEKGTHKIWFKNCAANYSDESLERLIRQAVAQRSINVWGYDTLKHGTGSDMSKWSDLVQTTTKLCVLNQNLPTAAIMTCQLNNSAFNTKPEDLTYSSLANASYIYHLFDVMVAIQHMKPQMYEEYSLMTRDGEKKKYTNLNPDMQISSAVMLKNRRGSKGIFAISRDLDRNIWEQQNGLLIPKAQVESNLMW